jgi:hypothetical protein
MDDNNDETLVSAMKEIHVDTKSSNQNTSGKSFVFFMNKIKF